MKRLDALAGRWPALNALLDEALDLPAAKRAAWLETLHGERATLRETLRQLLAAHAGVETNDFLSTLPRLPPGDDGATGVGALAPGERVGPYRLIAELGRGGMGAVWRAERADGAFQRQVALKLPLLNRLRQDLALRFERERDILARLEHPHIARFYDAGISADGLPYLAMEFVDGQPIGEHCDSRRLEVPARLRQFAQVIEAVQHAHANLIVHRDLKPSNILVSADGDVRLLDFGIAKLLAGDSPADETQLTHISGRALTPDYASPEQIKGEPLTIASDVYSLGVVLYELLTGKRPYRLEINTPAQLEEAIVSVDPPRPSSVASDGAAQVRGVTTQRLARMLAGDLDTIVLKALAKAPRQRYATAAEFGADIERHLQGLPVLAQPDSLTYRARKFVLRHRLETAIAAALVIALIGGAYAQVAVTIALAVGSGVALWQTRAARTQARLAREHAARAEETKRFVLSFFEAADADRGGNRQTTAVDLLKQARDRLDAAPVSDHATRVELLMTIGSGLHGLGELQQAATLLAEAARLAEAKLENHERIATEAQVAYGQVLGLMGSWKEAERHFDAAERRSRRSGDMKGLSAALRGKASMLADNVQYDRAIELGWEAVRAAESQAPPIDKRAVIASNLALTAQLHIAERKGAIGPAQRAYALAQELYGNRPTAQLLEAQMRYVNAIASESDAADAVDVMRGLLQRQVEVFGADHPEVARGLMSLGQLSLKLGDPRSAIESMTESVRIWALLGDGKPTVEVAGSKLNLGAVLANAQRHAEALSVWREAESLYCAIYSPTNEAARVARSGVALMLTKLGRLDEADALFAELLAQPFSSAIEQVFISGRLGQLRSAQGRHDEALALLRGAPDFFADAPKGRQRGLTLAYLGAALVAARRHAEALEHLHQARAILRESMPNGSPDLADVALDIARAQLGLGRANDAVEAAEEACAFWNRFDPAHRSSGIALLWHARALNAIGSAREADATVRRATAIVESAGLPADRALLAQTRHDLSASQAVSRTP